MVGVYSSCARCGLPLLHPPGRGKARKYCGDPCQKESDAERLAAKVLHPCNVEGCTSLANRVGTGMCEKHYIRVRRRGTTERLGNAKPGDISHSSGYVLTPAPGHPMARGYRAFAHRVVYYDAHGAGPFQCHWCQKQVTWAGMHIDHLDDNKTNNDISNLVASCPVCNQARGRPKMIETTRRKAGITFNGQTMTTKEWAATIGVVPSSMGARLKKWPLSRALTQPRGTTGPRRREGEGDVGP